MRFSQSEVVLHSVLPNLGEKDRLFKKWSVNTDQGEQDEERF